MKQKTINKYSVTALAIAIIAAATSGVIFVKHHSADTTALTKVSSTKPAKSNFIFTGAKDWRQGPANKTSMALFYNPDDCFISLGYDAGIVNEAAELEKVEKGWAGSGYTFSQANKQVVTMQTTAGQKQYELYQYDVKGDGSDGKLYGGQEFGYIQLTNGYLDVEGYCEPTGNLPATIPALEAIKFDQGK